MNLLVFTSKACTCEGKLAAKFRNTKVPLIAWSDRFFSSGTWGNTAAQITTVQFLLQAAGNYNSGSRAWCEGY
jgi:hypothetical protein